MESKLGFEVQNWLEYVGYVRLYRWVKYALISLFSNYIFYLFS